jgi:hypothetical protein
MVLRFLGIQKRCYVGNILAMASFAGARAWKKIRAFHARSGARTQDRWPAAGTKNN